MIKFLWHFIEYPVNTVTALVAGAFLHVTLKALWVKYFGQARSAVTSILPK
jgi:hypothetical protein